MSTYFAGSWIYTRPEHCPFGYQALQHPFLQVCSSLIIQVKFQSSKKLDKFFFAVPMPILGWKSLTLVWLGGLTMKVALMSKNCRYCHCYHHNCNFHHHYLQFVIQFIYICDILKTQGTVEFIAPELISCKTASTSSDMWSDLQYINTLQYINIYIYISLWLWSDWLTKYHYY